VEETCEDGNKTFRFHDMLVNCRVDEHLAICHYEFSSMGLVSWLVTIMMSFLVSDNKPI
jgi:hypothetical protein